MQHAEFVHLHAHTEYSLLDGACRITDDKGKPSEFLKSIAAMKMPALAITDHGNLFGAVEFYRTCSELGIKPIIGCEIYVAPKSRLDKTGAMVDSNNHLILLAKNEKGYKNLMALTSYGYLDGFYYKPRIDKELLKEHAEGLIALTGCLKGELAQAVLSERHDKAREAISEYKSILGDDNVYLEMMRHGLPEQEKVLESLQKLSQETKTKLVATNDCHYVKKEDAEAHDVLLCIGTGKLLTDTHRLKYSYPEFYYKSPQEMAKLFSFCPEALKNTLEVTEKCHLDLSFNQILLPHYEVPAGQTADSYLEKLCLEGLVRRYGRVIPEHKARLDYELSVIKAMGFSAYFLIVWDFVSYAKAQGIPVGPGRGSGAGSLAAYCLGITNICPMANGLLFERFLNPDRRTMPDLDIDFSDSGRDRVIEYVRQKYGATNVAQIITFGSMLARLVVRDVGRVMNMPLAEVDKIAKLIPRELGTTITHALDAVPELKELYDSDPQVKKLIDVSKRLEGLKRHTGVHAAGIVIAKEQIVNYSPLAKGSKEVVTTQYNDESLLKLGLLKVDFLGLRTLTIIRDTEEMIRQRHDPKFDIEKISLEDQTTFKFLMGSKTNGVFQLESSGMRDLLRKLRPNRLEDIVSLISLYRPGPIGSGMLDEFVARKHGKTKVVYDHPLLEPILKDTYGITVYQEQVMRISRDLAGFTPGQADNLRKAMGKKIPEEIQKQRDVFIEGCLKNHIPKALATKIFEAIAHFGGYGFNKSHASAYGLIAYQTAYLKANYPLEFMTALLNSEIGRGPVAGKDDGRSKLVEYLDDAESLGIKILAPDVQHSMERFAIEGQNIRFGLLAIKNVGENAVAAIVAAREKEGAFKSFEDFCLRIDQRLANQKVFESLIKAGAFDSLSQGEPQALHRAKLMNNFSDLLDQTAKKRRQLAAGQTALFDFSETMTATIPDRPVEPWTDQTLLSFEKEMLGFYLSGHPLANFKEQIQALVTHSLGHLPEGPGTKVRVAGLISQARRLLTKGKGEAYARFRLEDLQGDVEVLVFPRSYTPELAKLITPNSMVVVLGRTNQRAEEATEIIAEEIFPLESAWEQMPAQLLIKLSSATFAGALPEQLKGILKNFPGKCPVYFKIQTAQNKTATIESQVYVSPSRALLDQLESFLGPDCFDLKAKSLF